MYLLHYTFIILDGVLAMYKKPVTVRQPTLLCQQQPPTSGVYRVS
jgi:hypothetical protein